jgi:predicted MFS family arabinose efflux permease
VADVFPEERRGRATGLLMSAFAVASVVGVPIGIALGNRYGWGVPFHVLAALGLPLLGMAAWTMPPYKATRGTLYKFIKTVKSASEGCVTDE